MYLHIGNNNILRDKEIIGIFDIESLKKSKYINDFLQKLKSDNLIENISKDVEKTLILVEQDNNIKGYISNISSVTLSKRI